MTVNRTFPAIPNDLREWTRYLSGLFFDREFTATLLGCTTEPSGTARYTASAGIVCLSLPSLTGTSDSAAAIINGLPQEITPENHDQACIGAIIDNGVIAPGFIVIGTDTGITLYKDLDLGSFTASGTKGLRGCCITYRLD